MKIFHLMTLLSCLLVLAACKEKLKVEPGGVKNANGRGPIKGDFTINNNAVFRTQNNVTLSVQVENADEMRFSNDNLHWTPWEPVKLTKTWQLPDPVIPETGISSNPQKLLASKTQSSMNNSRKYEPIEISNTVYAEFGYQRYHYLKRSYKIYYFQKKDFFYQSTMMYPYFGYSLAMSNNAKQIIIGIANQRKHDEQFALHGVPLRTMYGVHTFYWEKKEWVAARPLFPVNRQQNPAYRVALSPDGSTLVIDERIDHGQEQVTTLYIYRWLGRKWTKEKRIGGSSRDHDIEFGNRIALSRDGNTILVGAPLKATSDFPEHGAVYIYRWTGHYWEQPQVLIGEEDREHEHLGKSLAISADASTVAVATRCYLQHEKMGCIYIYTNRNGHYLLQEKVHLSSQEDRYHFATDIALSSDGSLLAASTTAINTATGSGAVYLFKRENRYVIDSVLHAPSATLKGCFGKKIALSSDGNALAVNAFPETTLRSELHGTEPGAIFLFKTDGSSWELDQEYEGRYTTKYDYFGRDFCLSSDGRRILMNELYRHDKNLDRFGSGIVLLR